MAKDLDDVVKVTLTAQTQAVATASFEIPAILATFTNFSERARSYGDIDEVADDFPSTSLVYKIATQLFGQSSVLGAVPPSIVVGRRQVDGVDGSVATVSNNTAYSVTINGTVFSYTSDGSALATEIAAGLKAAFDAAPISGITFTDNLDGTFEVDVVTPGTAWSITASTNLTLVNKTPTETYVDALGVLENTNDDWYLLVIDSHEQADQEAVSDAIQARKKIFGISSQDTAAPTTATTDIGYSLSAQSHGRTFGVYLPTADAEYPEAVWAGSQLAVTPGSNDWDFKRGVGATVSKLTSTQINNLESKNWNYYLKVGGANVFQNGDMFDGNPIDLRIGQDWLIARIQEAIFFRLINSLKIPLTNPGLLIIENELRAVLSLAQSNGLIDAGWTVQTPDVLSITPNDRANRIARTFLFTARVQGAVRSIEIRGTLQV